MESLFNIFGPKGGIGSRVGQFLGFNRLQPQPQTQRISELHSIPPQRISELHSIPLQSTRPSSSVPVSTGVVGQPQQPQNIQTAQNFFEQAPAAPEIDFDALIAPALQALGQVEEAARSGSETQISDIETAGKTRVGKAQLQQTQQQQELAQRKARTERLAESAISETGRQSESAISEARRGFSELERGLISRFGTGVSTGLGATAILGNQTLSNIANVRSQALRNVGEVRANLQEALNNIETTRTGLSDVTNQVIREIEGQTEGLKNQARSELRQTLAQIGQAKGELQARKAQLAMNAMENYRSAVASVNQRNTEFKQKIFLEAQRAEGNLNEARERGRQLLSRATTPSFPIRTITLPDGSQQLVRITPQGAEQIPFRETNVRGFSPTRKLSEEEKRRQEISQLLEGQKTEGF